MEKQYSYRSGVGSDPSIQTQHPFENPEVVFAGTLYPYIKYMYFDGIKYTASYEIGSRYSPDLIDCLDPVIVDPVTCSTTLGADPLYPYYLTYINERDVAADKSREIKFDISSDTKYLGWEFWAYDVAEQLKIYYCTSTNTDGTLLDNFIIGSQNATGGTLTTNLYPANYPDGSARTYYRSRFYGVKYVTNLSDFTYSDQDYLRIQIIGSVLEPSNTNTNWGIKLKCFTTSDISCAFYDSSISKLDTSMDPSISLITSSTGSCLYQLSYYTLKDASNLTKNYIRTTDPWLWKYTQMDILDSNSNPSRSGTMVDPVKQGLYWYTGAGSNWMWIGEGYTTCQNLSAGQTITVTRTTDPSTVVFSFTDIADYNVFVSNITSIQADADYATWLTLTDEDPRYYGYYSMYWNDASSCGDTQSTSYIYFHLSSSIGYDAINKTITFIPVVPAMSSAIFDTSTDECNTTYSAINTRINYMRSTKYGRANWHYTKVRMQNPVASQWVINTNQQIRSVEGLYGFYIDDPMLNNICDLSSTGFIHDVSTPTSFRYYFPSNRWTLFRWWDRFSFTGNTSTHESRMQNWRLERKIMLETDSSIDTGFETIYDVSHGVFLIGG